MSKDPKALKAATVGWAAPFPGDASGDNAVVYSMQWNNPRPDARIESVDMLPGPDGRKWGAPALLAITAGEAIE